LLPVSIHKLTSLQELTFIVGQERDFSINEQGTLINLRKLFISDTENITYPDKAKSANLLKEGKSHVTFPEMDDR
jgi:hypothetical protein